MQNLSVDMTFENNRDEIHNFHKMGKEEETILAFTSKR
jgi:hypothetical protein